MSRGSRLFAVRRRGSRGGGGRRSDGRCTGGVSAVFSDDGDQMGLLSLSREKRVSGYNVAKMRNPNQKSERFKGGK